MGPPYLRKYGISEVETLHVGTVWWETGVQYVIGTVHVDTVRGRRNEHPKLR